jgi:cytochrome c
MAQWLPRAGAIAFMVLILNSPTWAQDVNAGRDVYLATCISCHKFKCNSNGPRLEGLIGRRVGTAVGYDSYTQGLLDAEFDWSAEALDKFLAAPNELFPESTMAWAGKVENSEDRKNLIAYLQTDDPSVNLCPSE